MAQVATLFESGKEVYRGYVDDPRNTDNAWMETSAYHFHCKPEIAQLFKFQAGDDAANVRWLGTEPAALEKMFASHGILVEIALGRLGLNGRFSHRESVSDA